MSFIIRTPFSIASHIRKASGTAAVTNKTKAGGIVIDTADQNRLKYNKGGTVVSIYTGIEAAVASGGTTRTLTAAGSGTTNLFDSAAGITYTLPTPVAGMEFTFLWSVGQTSSNHIVTAGAGKFLSGAIIMFSGEDVTPSSTLGPKMFAGNGTTHIKYTSNATTLGSGIGTWLFFKALSTTVWLVSGVVNSPSGTLATPFST